jgi:thioredoxin-related protein
MNRSLMRLFLLALVLILISFRASLAKGFDDSEVKHIDYPGWFIQSPFFDLKEDLDKARSDGKQGLMVLFTTEGCSYCDLFIRKSLGDPEIASIVQNNLDSVGLEIFDDAEMTDPRGTAMSVKQFAKKEGAGFSPTLLFFGDDGERVLRVVGYQSPERFKTILSYVTGKNYRTESLPDYFARLSEKAAKGNRSAGLKNDPLFTKPPYELDRSRFPASQPLLVIFEKAGCGECEDFHTSVLASKEVRDALKHFEIVRFEAADNKTTIHAPGGNRVTPASWFKQTAFTRVPALLFFDEKGNEVLRTDALVLRQRMMNSLNYVLEGAYEKGWTYQRFARSKAMEKFQKEEKKEQ